MTYSRRTLLAAIGLALPAVSLLAVDAQAASASSKKRKAKHSTTPVSSKRHKTPPHTLTTRG